MLCGRSCLVATPRVDVQFMPKLSCTDGKMTVYLITIDENVSHREPLLGLAEGCYAVVQSDFCKNAVRTLKQQLNVNKHKTDDGTTPSASVFVTLAALQGKCWRWHSVRCR
jgi:hypothetical protein